MAHHVNNAQESVKKACHAFRWGCGGGDTQPVRGKTEELLSMQGSEEKQTQGSRVAGSRASSHLLCHPIFEMSLRSDCLQQMVSIAGKEATVLGMRPNLHTEKLLANFCSVPDA